MIRFLMIALIVILVWVAFQRLGRLLSSNPPRSFHRPDGAATGELLVSCAHCGARIPRSRSVESSDLQHRLAGSVFCSIDCVQAATVSSRDA